MKGWMMQMMLSLWGCVAIVTASTSEQQQEQQQTRVLQAETRLYDISDPVVSYTGMQLDLDYEVRDQITSDQVDVTLLQEDCNLVLSDDIQQAFTIDIINDLTAFGDGSGTRTITTSLNLNPTKLAGTRIVSYPGDQGLVSFCVRFSLKDPDTDAVQNSHSKELVVGVDLTDKIEITAVLDPEESGFQVEAFECTKDNERVADSPTKTQGDTIRLCIQPDEYTQTFGVRMKSIVSYKLVRGDVLKDILIPNGVVANLDLTTVSCKAGDVLCSVETVISNEFYYSLGTVNAMGEVWLQYEFAGGRKLVSVPISTATEDSNNIDRALLAPGDFIGGRPFLTTFEVDPSLATYNAVVFQCDESNVPLSSKQANRDKARGETVRVCAIPDPEAMERGVYMRAISSFFYEQGENVQFAVEPTNKRAQDGKSLHLCYPGEPICVFKTILSEVFFDSKDPVIGQGEIILQYGIEPPPRDSSSRQLSQQHGRATQITDAGFAGLAEVNLQFTVDPKKVAVFGKTWQEKANDWWTASPLWLRILFIMGAIFALTVCFCFLYAIFCADFFRVKDPLPVPEKKQPEIFVQPYVPADRGVDVSEEEDTTVATPAPRPVPTKHHSFLKLEAEASSTRSPRPGAKKSMSTNDARSVNSGPQSPLKRRGGSKSPRPGKKKSAMDGSVVSEMDSTYAPQPKRASSLPVGSQYEQSPKLRRGNSVASAKSTGSKSPKSRRGGSKSPLPKRGDSIRGEDSMRSPRPGGRKKKASTTDSPMSARKSKNKIQSPGQGGRRAGLSESHSATPRNPKKKATASALPEELPF